MKHFIFLIIFVLFSAGSVAEDTGFHVVDKVVSGENGSFRIWLVEEDMAAHECDGPEINNPRPYEYIVSRDTIGFEEKVSLAISAKITSIPVRIGFECIDNNAHLTVLRFK